MKPRWPRGREWLDLFMLTVMFPLLIYLAYLGGFFG